MPCKPIKIPDDRHNHDDDFEVRLEITRQGRRAFVLMSAKHYDWMTKRKALEGGAETLTSYCFAMRSKRLSNVPHDRANFGRR